MIDSGIGHKEFTLIINEEKSYISLKKASEQKTVNQVTFKVMINRTWQKYWDWGKILGKGSGLMKYSNRMRGKV